MDVLSSELKAMLRPGPGNPRNSEGSFLRLDDGRIAFAFSRYVGTSYDDHARCNICVIYSHDDGETWDTEHVETLVDAIQYGVQNVMSVSLIRLNNGDIGLFYIKKGSSGISSQYMLRRYRGDFSQLLSEVLCFPGNYDAYYVVNNDRVLCMQNGTLVVPTAYHLTSMREGVNHFDGRGVVHTFSSEDDGVTWKENRGTISLDDGYSATGLQEPGLLELMGGVLYCYCRTDRMWQYETVSLDQGKNWFRAQPSKFASPDSPMLIKKNPYSGKFYAIWNPIPKYPYRQCKSYSWGREPLVMADSEDGVNFGNCLDIETDTARGYCYPAMYFLDEKTMLIAYCNGGEADGCVLNSTAIRKIVLK